MATTDIIFNLMGDLYLVLLYGWPFMILLWIFALKVKWKNWPLDVVIIESRGNNLSKSNDRAGKYIDPYTKITGYRLQKNKDTLPVINFEWILHNVPQHTTIFDRFVNIIRGNVGTVFLFKYGTKQYKPVVITNNNQRKLIYKLIKDKNNPKLLQVYEQFDPRKHLGALDFQVIDWDNMNFMVQEQRASLERRQKKGKFWKEVIIPLGIIAFTTLVCIIMIKFSYDYAIAVRGSAPPTQTPSAANIPIISDLIPTAT